MRRDGGNRRTQKKSRRVVLRKRFSRKRLKPGPLVLAVVVTDNIARTKNGHFQTKGCNPWRSKCFQLVRSFLFVFFLVILCINIHVCMRACCVCDFPVWRNDCLFFTLPCIMSSTFIYHLLFIVIVIFLFHLCHCCWKSIVTGHGPYIFTLRLRIQISRQQERYRWLQCVGHNGAWNNGIGHRFWLAGFSEHEVMKGQGHPQCAVMARKR